MVHAKFFATVGTSLFGGTKRSIQSKLSGSFDGMINDRFIAKRLAAANRQCLAGADDVECLQSH